jgi:ATP-binding cassette, subfamily B, bacterial PglK
MNTNTILKVYEVLDSISRKKVFLLFILILFGTILEIFSLGLFIPIMSSLVSTDFSSDYPRIVEWIPFLGGLSQREIVIFGVSSISILYFVKFIYFIFLIRIQGKFVYGVQAKLSLNLLKSYIYRPYVFYLQENTSHLIRNSTTEVGVYSGVLAASLNLVTEIFVLLGVISVLIYVQPFSTLIIASALFLSLYLYQFFTKSLMLQWGRERQYHEGKRIQFLQQSFGGVKDSKLLGRENFFVKQYSNSNSAVASVGRKQYILQQIPRYWLELLIILVLSLLVIITMSQTNSVQDVIPIIGLFSIASFRMMPSTNRVLNSLQRIRLGIPAVSLISQEIDFLRKEKYKKNHNQGSELNFNEFLKLEKVGFSYPNSDLETLTNINIKIKKGDFVGIIGTSGAGKSTLVDIILGLLDPQSGNIFIDKSELKDHLNSWQDKIGYVPQNIYLTDDTLKSNIAFGIDISNINESLLKNAIINSQLEEFVNSLPSGVESMVGERGVRISGGQRQRIGIARALYHNPEILVLDEATSSLDVETEKRIMDSINLLIGSKTIIIVSHRYTTVSKCNHIFRLDKGKIVQNGTYKELINK